MFVQCASRKKITYNIPVNFPEEQRKQLLVVLDKGKKLYKANCAECHGIFTKGKDKVPNFTSSQIDNYSARFVARDAKNHAMAIQMSPDQLGQVLTFLRYRKAEPAK